MQTHVAQFSLVAKRVSVAYCIVYSGQPEALALTNSQEEEMHWLDFYAVYPIQPCLWAQLVLQQQHPRQACMAPASREAESKH